IRIASSALATMQSLPQSSALAILQPAGDGLSPWSAARAILQPAADKLPPQSSARATQQPVEPDTRLPSALDQSAEPTRSFRLPCATVT
ncbi:MAG: hypothetical protein NTV52_22295, partial [Acidobacteria bacterium]|nr:hypothetical protein [Acidobacteriota bacterium]